MCDSMETLSGCVRIKRGEKSKRKVYIENEVKETGTDGIMKS